MSTMLKERHALAKLRAELEGKKRKLCRSCKGFGHLARNCRNKRREKKGTVIPQNKFEVLKSRVMQCGVEERAIKSMRTVGVKCFKYEEKGHKCRECPAWMKRKKEEKAARMARPQKAQQEERPAHPVREKVQEKRLSRVEEEKAVCPIEGKAQQKEWRRSSWEDLRKRAEWYCGPTVPQDAELWELGWRGQGAVVIYLKCPRCRKGGCYAEDDRGQGVLPYWRREKISWCGCKGKEGQSSMQARDLRGTARKEKAVRPREAKVQQSSTRSGEPESTAREGKGSVPTERKCTTREGSNRQEVRRTFKMLREVWLNIGVEKIDMYEGVMIKALLDSGVMGMFMDRQTAARHGFKLQKLERPLVVRNVDSMNNSGGAITYQVECNVFYKGHTERMRMDMCDLGKTEVILGMPWLAVHNPEINWETGEVKMTRCPPLCGGGSQKKERVKRIATEEEEKIVRWAIDDKED